MFSARFYRKRGQLSLRLDEIIRQCLSADGIPPVSDAAADVFGDFAIGKFPEQREMRFFLGDLAAFTPRLVNALRGLVAEEFPKWSIVPQFDSHVFTITANAVVFRDRVARGSIDDGTPAFAEWHATASEYDTNRYGPMRDQVHWLRPLLPAAVVVAGSSGFAVVEAFDFYVPHFWDGNPVVWVVVGSTLAEAGVEVEGGTTLRKSFVTATGFVFPEHTSSFEVYTAERPAALLLTVEFAREDQTRLRLRTLEGQPIGPVVIPRILGARDVLPTKREAG